MAADILVVDDEVDIRELVAGLLEDEGYDTRMASHSDEALELIEQRRPSLIFLDIWLQGSRLDGLALLAVIKQKHPELPVVMISGHGGVETAVAAIKRGAYDFIEKPFKADRLILVAERALEASSLKRKVKDLQSRSGGETKLVGSSSPMNNLRQMIQRVGPTNSRVLISGQSGSGKELVARCIHQQSPRSEAPFVIFSSIQFAMDDLEFQLFGTEADGATQRKVGALEEAHGGTLYLEEISDLPHEMQSKLTRVLTTGKFIRVGGSKAVQVDVRVISSTSRNMEGLISEGVFREDLFHRLSVVPLAVPPLAERREDIPELVLHFMEQLSSTSGLPARKIGEDAMAILQAHNWPGNIRQLRNNIERLLILTKGDENAVITADLLPNEVGETVPSIPGGGEAGEQIMSLPLKKAREVFEREYLKAQIARFGGNVSRTAEFVGMERSALHRKLKSLGVV
ncbi:two-component system, NtrC family, nitrogen regulation response regulator NtrX [Cohaesibacter marisflavi]|uniref:Two-component system, NtrC family, nitrogen regulation response regulator NtrX n=1 Tax=Cohaesibacter marisflavi TaxID=655353 RepID=A0A1I5FFY7_9HYPH|nr:sigma-54 dependent transcriptional regulator [Cohaesibacter marisflavi]SFO22612.1 two-component system, NtrC family, nitrogen regulation response regulator NtrX [Cohaesibacter marisflavi]